MKRVKLFFLIVLCLCLLLANNSSIISARAQSLHSGYDDPNDYQNWEQSDGLSILENFPYSEIQNYREDWNHAWNKYEELAKLFQNDTLLQIVTHAQDLELTDENIASFMAAGADLKPLLDALDDLSQKIIVKYKGGKLLGSSGFPNAGYSGLCGSERNDTTIVFAAQVALQAAELVWSAASRGCDEVIVVCPAPGGGNTSLVCIAADAVLFAAKAVLDDFKFCDEDVDSAEIEGSYERLAHLHNDINTLDEKINTLLDEVANLRRQNCEIIKLLHTPQGQRQSSIDVCDGSEGFPYDWPLQKEKSTDSDSNGNSPLNDQDNDNDGLTDSSDPDCLSLCGDGTCDWCEDCKNCSFDCKGQLNGKPGNRYCCGDGIQQSSEGNGMICNGNF